MPGVLLQLPAQLPRQKDGADLPLQGDLRPALPHCLRRDIAHLADPDAGGTDGLHQQGQPTPPQAAGRLHQPGVLLPAELPGGVPEQLPLHPQVLHPAVLPAQRSQQAVQGSQLAVDRGGGLAGGQLLPPGGGQLPGHLTAAQEGGELADLPQVFFQGGGAALLLSQLSGKGRQRLLCDLPWFHMIPPVSKGLSLVYLDGGGLLLSALQKHLPCAAAAKHLLPGGNHKGGQTGIL